MRQACRGKIHAEISNELIGEIAEEVVLRVLELLDARVSESQYMDVPRTAAYLCCSKGRLYELARRREIPFFKFGGRLLFSSP